jgi:hypothetical protein
MENFIILESVLTIKNQKTKTEPKESIQKETKPCLKGIKKLRKREKSEYLVLFTSQVVIPLVLTETVP